MMLLGKTIVVTGAASGIGAATAALAQSLGADVIGVDRNEPRSSMAGFVVGDLSTADGVAAIVPRLPSRFDALCNVAGLSGAAGAAITLAVNFVGLRALTEAVAGRMGEGSAVIDAASIAGYGWRANLERAKAMVAAAGFPDVRALLARHGVGDEISYPVSKELLLLWTMKAAHEPRFRHRGIRINAVSPGPVETPILTEFRQVLGDARVDSDIARVGRSGTPSDIAPVVAFLCSDGARWVNGANIPADGGLEASVNAEVLEF